MLTLMLLAAGVVGANADNATLDQLGAAYGTGLSGIPKSYPVSVTDAVIFGSDANAQVGNANVNNYDYLYVTVTDFVDAVGIFANAEKTDKIVIHHSAIEEQIMEHYTRLMEVKEGANGTKTIRLKKR